MKTLHAKTTVTHNINSPRGSYLLKITQQLKLGGKKTTIKHLQCKFSNWKIRFWDRKHRNCKYEKKRESLSISSCYYFAIKVHHWNSESHRRLISLRCFCGGNRQPWNWYLHIFPYLFTRSTDSVDCCDCVCVCVHQGSQSVHFITCLFFIIFTLNGNSCWSFFLIIWNICAFKNILMKSSWVTVYVVFLLIVFGWRKIILQSK